MTKQKKPRNPALLLVIVVDIILLASVFLLMTYAQFLLNKDVRINLTEIVTQNKDVITSRLMMELNNLDLMSKQLAERFSTAGSGQTKKQIFLDYASQRGGMVFSWANAEGLALFPDGREVDISGRKYFRLSMDGVPNISERTVSRLTGEDIFVLSVPLNIDGKVVGTIQQQYTPQEIYKLCAISLYSEQGYIYIINSEGYILLGSQNDGYILESDNLYWMIYQTDPETSKALESDIRAGKGGFFETTLAGRKSFSAYTPIDQVYDWFLISSVDTKAVSANTDIVVRLFYTILLVLVVLFSFSLFYLLRMKKKQQLALEKLAFVDGVTGGDTLTKFTLDWQNTLQSAPEGEYSLLALDIDNFKFINSFYGFAKGDHTLAWLYQRYQKKLMEGEYIARVSGDHFVLLLKDASLQRLNGFFEPEIAIDDIKIYLSAGLYPIHDKSQSLNLMMDKANMAVRNVKNMRDKQVAVYSESDDQKMMFNEQLKRSLELAITRDEIVPYFQPKVDVFTQKLVGAEALARWQTQDGTLVPPGTFIPLCEETGLITVLDTIIFEKTLQFLKECLETGVDCVPISVNLSRRHLFNRSFLDMIFSKLDEYGVPPELIELELTETIFFDNYQNINNFIEELHARGFKVSMDDFGSGYSSLNMLHDVDIDILKIDRGFLRGTDNSERQKAVFGAIVQMAENLKITVVVEGVEFPENVSLLKEFNCHIAQGFYYAKPMPKKAFGKVCKEGYIQ